jgi:hypothetical protein
VDPVNQDGSSGKDPSTYSWTLDTLFFSFTPNGFGQTIMNDIWGMNDTLVYDVLRRIE